VVNDLLVDAWSCTDRFAAGCDPVQLQSILDGYTRTLLTMGVEHDRDVLRLRLRPLLAPALEPV
jgi:hypothetical protein